MSKKRKPDLPDPAGDFDPDKLSSGQIHRLLFLGLAPDDEFEAEEGLENIARAADRDFAEGQTASGSVPPKPELIN